MSIGCRCVHKPVVRKRPVPKGGSKENAPSRWSLRPTIRLTSAEATVTRRVINLRHSVLGASRTLGGGLDAVKRRSSALVANCDVFFSHRVALRIDAPCSGVPKKERAGHVGPAAKFAEPGTLSSTFPTNVPLPRTAPRGASTYRRPVLGAAALYANPDTPIKVVSEGNARKLRRCLGLAESERRGRDGGLYATLGPMSGMSMPRDRGNVPG